MQRNLSMFDILAYLIHRKSYISNLSLCTCAVFSYESEDERMTMKMKRQEVLYRIAERMERRSTKDTDFVDPRGDKYFRFVRTKKGSVDSRLGCNEA